jgi:CubicO group peptidase (beta-lactamase class C family)
MLFIEPFAGNMARPYTPEELLDMVIKKGTLDFEPGQKAEYSNTGYLVLGLLIEKVSGLSYDDFLRRKVIAPLAMHRTSPRTDKAIVPWRAAGYTIEHDAAGKAQVLNAQWVSILPPFSTGGVMSGPADFIRLIDMDKMLRPDTVKKMMKPGKVAHDKAVPIKTGPGSPDLTIHYGLGFELLRFSDSKETLAAKNGVIPGFSSWYVYFPDKKIAVAASANNEKAILPLLVLIREVASSFR